MTSTERLAVGPEMDAAVALALGWTVIDGYWVQPPGCRANLPLSENAPPSSTDGAAAGEVVECLRRRGWDVEIRAEARMPQPYLVSLIHPDDDTYSRGCRADTMPEAVCRVVLLAAEVLKGGGE